MRETQRILKETEFKLTMGGQRAELMKDQTRFKAHELCEYVARRGSMHREEVQKVELEHAEVFLKKLEKKAKNAEKSRKQQRDNARELMESNQEKHDKTLKIAQDYADTQAKFINQMNKKKRRVENKLKEVEENKEKDIIEKRERQRLTKIENDKRIEFSKK